MENVYLFKWLLVLSVVSGLLFSCAGTQDAQDMSDARGYENPEALFGNESFLLINEIQGAGHISPEKGNAIPWVPGVVTALRGALGFYMQNPFPDDDPATSEGIFVSNRRPLNIKAGDLVKVRGKVREYYPTGTDSGSLSITQITRPEIEVISEGYPLPEPVVIGKAGRIPPKDSIWQDSPEEENVESSPFTPDSDGIDFYETLESMIVEVRDPLVVGSIHTAYGEIHIIGDGGSWTDDLTPRGGLIIDRGDENPESIIIDVIENQGIIEIDPVPFLTVGDRFSGAVRGIVDYNFHLYKILPTEVPPPAIKANLERETTGLTAKESDFTLATFNVENLSAKSADTKFDDLAETIVLGLHNPDIIALQEIQDNSGTEDDGITAADATYRKLIEAIEGAGGPSTYAFLDISPVDGAEGGAPGGNIRNGFLYNTERVEIPQLNPGGSAEKVEVELQNGGAVLSRNPGRIDPANRAFFASRVPLVCAFSFRGESIFIINLHLNSKGSDNPLWGKIQPPRRITAVQREKQAEVIRGFIDEVFSLDVNAKIIVLGDMNEFAFRKPLEVLAGSDLHDLATELLPLNERYTYVYQNNSQALDHIMVTGNLLGGVRVDIVHRYAEYLYGMRQTDHDPILAVFSF
ncbi:MAG: endonuclease/exonuclease/phosphatase family protein [Spirochaetales bacterium]|nr:endonuclease/exonuclease/phosphatase family protein [Spirochaetales bacterium]